MKKTIVFVISILLVVCFLIPKDEEIRVRIISNSNSDADLSYKTLVVDYFKEEIIPNISLTKDYFKNNEKKIQAMFEARFDDVSVSFESHTFTNKTYNSNAAPNGVYDTLVIRIGNASGDNWWASIYDGMLVSESVDKVEYRWWLKELVG